MKKLLWPVGLYLAAGAAWSLYRTQTNQNWEGGFRGLRQVLWAVTWPYDLVVYRAQQAKAAAIVAEMAANAAKPVTTTTTGLPESATLSGMIANPSGDFSTP